MAIKQVYYYIPPNLSNGIMSGVYKRFGGVVRDAKNGQIVKHLKEVEMSTTKKSGSAVMKAIKAHSVAAIGIVASIATTATISYVVKKKRERKYKSSLPIYFIKFDNSLKRYLEAIRTGKLDEKTIDDLMQSLDMIMKEKNGEQILLKFSKTELKQLMNIIYHYTNELSNNNLVKIDNIKQSSPNLINNFHNYLKVQKQIFKEVA